MPSHVLASYAQPYCIDLKLNYGGVFLSAHNPAKLSDKVTKQNYVQSQISIPRLLKRGAANPKSALYRSSNALD